MQIINGNVVRRLYTIFQNLFNIFIVNARFFHEIMLLLPKMVFCGALKQKGELTF